MHKINNAIDSVQLKFESLKEYRGNILKNAYDEMTHRDKEYLKLIEDSKKHFKQQSLENNMHEQRKATLYKKAELMNAKHNRINELRQIERNKIAKNLHIKSFRQKPY